MIKNAKKIVIKVGTSTLTYDTGLLNIRKIEKLCNVICDLQNSGKKIILVSSGAISAGWSKIGLASRPTTTEERQAAAAVGQNELMNFYDRNMEKYGKVVAQILLTKDAIDNPLRRHNAESTLKLLLEHGCIPIVNENDCVSCEEIKFGGNDTLSAYVACLADADLLINLSDVDGLYDCDPRKNPDAKLIPVVEDPDSVLSMASGAGTQRGTGGMFVKITAAKIAGDKEIPMIIANGEDPAILYDILESDEHRVGTLFVPSKREEVKL